jgi:two-component system, cell cycle sensor histidine kinase and response regulator CckA
MLSAPVLLRRFNVLVVDDEEPLRVYVARVLENEGYDVITAADGVEALALLKQAGALVHLVITDVFMPNLSGPELANCLAGQATPPPVLFMSGNYGSRELPGPLLPKPFLPEELSRLVRNMLAGQPTREPTCEPTAKGHLHLVGNIVEMSGGTS